MEVRAGSTEANSAIASVLPPGSAVFEMPIVTAAAPSATHAQGSRSGSVTRARRPAPQRTERRAP